MYFWGVIGLPAVKSHEAYLKALHRVSSRHSTFPFVASNKRFDEKTVLTYRHHVRE